MLTLVCVCVRVRVFCHQSPFQWAFPKHIDLFHELWALEDSSFTFGGQSLKLGDVARDAYGFYALGTATLLSVPLRHGHPFPMMLRHPANANPESSVPAACQPTTTCQPTWPMCIQPIAH